jgi:putative transposase
MPQQEESLIEPNACYYLTFHVVDWADIFVKPVFKQIIAESLNYFIARKGLTVYSWCLMTNHLQLMASAKQGSQIIPLTDEFRKFTTRIILEDIEAESEVRRSWIMKRFRKTSGPFRLNTQFHVWQNRLDAIHIDLDNDDLFNQYLEIIHNNPVRERVVSKPEDYLHSSARDYAGVKGLVNIVLPHFKNESHFILRHIAL